LAESGAQMVFGVSAGGLVVLEAARTLPGIRMIAVYEPALAMDATRNTAWLERFDRELADGKLAAAMITSMYGLELAPPFFKIMPRRLLASLTEKAMKSEDAKAAPDAITMRWFSSRSYSLPGHSPWSTQIRVGWTAGLGRGCGDGPGSGRSGGPGGQGGKGGRGGNEPARYVIISRLLLSLPRPVSPATAR
jgi:pimeloyl-ACP methyl ester carboxylesterase